MKALCLARPQSCPTADESDLPDLTAFGECTHLAAILVYVDDFLAAGPRQVLQPLLTQLLHVWKGSNPDFLGREPGDVDTLRFLGLDIELGELGGPVKRLIVLAFWGARPENCRKHPFSSPL